MFPKIDYTHTRNRSIISCIINIEIGNGTDKISAVIVNFYSKFQYWKSELSSVRIGSNPKFELSYSSYLNSIRFSLFWKINRFSLARTHKTQHKKIRGQSRRHSTQLTLSAITWLLIMMRMFVIRSWDVYKLKFCRGERLFWQLSRFEFVLTL